MNDVTEGVSSFFNEGNVTTLVKNVTYGFSSSAAKFTESLSDGVGRVIMDERHEETRQKIRSNTAGSKDHLVAGFKGLGFGILGGMTSIFKQTYDGAANEGFPVRLCLKLRRGRSSPVIVILHFFQGFFAGLGKGVVGTITKPTVGILDFATESATALRESSRR
jgi:vacuolar protein sorting-associated protein 13D